MALSTTFKNVAILGGDMGCPNCRRSPTRIELCNPCTFLNDMRERCEKLSDKCECGNKHNPVGQGHSDWCKLFKKEF